MRKWSVISRAGLFLLLSIFLLGEAYAQKSSTLFTALPGARGDANQPWLRSAQPVILNGSALTQGEFEVPLAGSNYTAKLNTSQTYQPRLATVSDVNTHFGTLRQLGKREGNFILSEAHGNGEPDGLYAVFWLDGTNQAYSLQGDTARGYTLKNIELSALPGCGGAKDAGVHHAAQHSYTPHFREQPVTLGLETDALTVIDIVAGYTPQALAAAGSTATMLANINTAISLTNQVFVSNSKTDVIFRLVGTTAVAASEQASFSATYTEFRTLNTGAYPEVHALRDQVGADLITLFVESIDFCGLGAMPNARDNWDLDVLRTFGPSLAAFTVVNRECAASDETLAHEYGHNFGNDHDLDNATTNGFLNFSNGRRFTGTDGGNYRTIMSYFPNNQSYCFSSPDLTYKGSPTGVANQFDVRTTIITTAPVIAGYRATISDNPLPEVPGAGEGVGGGEGGGGENGGGEEGGGGSGTSPEAWVSVEKNGSTHTVSAGFFIDGSTAIPDWLELQARVCKRGKSKSGTKSKRRRKCKDKTLYSGEASSGEIAVNYKASKRVKRVRYDVSVEYNDETYDKSSDFIKNRNTKR